MKPEHYYDAFLLLAILGWLLLYMYLAFQFWCLMLKNHLKVSFSNLAVDIQDVLRLLNKELYPEDYFKARIYFVGTISTLLLPMIIGGLYNV